MPRASFPEKLHDAAKKGKTAEVRKLLLHLKTLKRIHACSVLNGKTAFQVAIINGHFKCVQLIWDRSKSLWGDNKNQSGILHEVYGAEDVMHCLLKDLSQCNSNTKEMVNEIFGILLSCFNLDSLIGQTEDYEVFEAASNELIHPVYAFLADCIQRRLHCTKEECMSGKTGFLMIATRGGNSKLVRELLGLCKTKDDVDDRINMFHSTAFMRTPEGCTKILQMFWRKYKELNCDLQKILRDDYKYCHNFSCHGHFLAFAANAGNLKSNETARVVLSFYKEACNDHVLFERQLNQCDQWLTLGRRRKLLTMLKNMLKEKEQSTSRTDSNASLATQEQNCCSTPNSDKKLAASRGILSPHKKDREKNDKNTSLYTKDSSTADNKQGVSDDNLAGAIDGVKETEKTDSQKRKTTDQISGDRSPSKKTKRTIRTDENLAQVTLSDENIKKEDMSNANQGAVPTNKKSTDPPECLTITDDEEVAERHRTTGNSGGNGNLSMFRNNKTTTVAPLSNCEIRESGGSFRTMTSLFVVHKLGVPLQLSIKNCPSRDHQETQLELVKSIVELAEPENTATTCESASLGMIRKLAVPLQLSIKNCPTHDHQETQLELVKSILELTETNAVAATAKGSGEGKSNMALG